MARFFHYLLYQIEIVSSGNFTEMRTMETDLNFLISDADLKRMQEAVDDALELTEDEQIDGAEEKSNPAKSA